MESARWLKVWISHRCVLEQVVRASSKCNTGAAIWWSLYRRSKKDHQKDGDRSASKRFQYFESFNNVSQIATPRQCTSQSCVALVGDSSSSILVRGSPFEVLFQICRSRNICCWESFSRSRRFVSVSYLSHSRNCLWCNRYRFLTNRAKPMKVEVDGTKQILMPD